MTEAITIYALPLNPSPARAGKMEAPDLVNDQFISGFSDVLAAINPLQQLPGVSTLYGALTGEAGPSSGARIIGGALFGGPIGLLAAIANEVIQGETGKDIGGNLLAMFSGEAATELADSSTGKNDYLPGNRRGALNSYLQAQSLFS